MYEKHEKLSRDYAKMWNELQEWSIVLEYKEMKQMSFDTLKLKLYIYPYGRVRAIKRDNPTKDDLLRYFHDQNLANRFPRLQIDKTDMTIEQVKRTIKDIEERLARVREIDVDTVKAYNEVRGKYVELKPIYYSNSDDSEYDSEYDIPHLEQKRSILYMRGYMAQLIPRWEEKIAQLAGLEARYLASEERNRIADDWDDERSNLHQLEYELKAVSSEIIEGDPKEMFTPLEWYDTRKVHDAPPWKQEELEKTVERRRESVAYDEDNLQTLRADPYVAKPTEWLRNRYTTAGNNGYGAWIFGGQKRLPKNTSVKRLQELARQEYARALETQLELLASTQEELTQAEEALADFVRRKQVSVKREEGESNAKAPRLGLLICGLLICGNCNEQSKKLVTCGNSCGIFYCNQKCADDHWLEHQCK